jgi:hypothetical protein
LFALQRGDRFNCGEVRVEYDVDGRVNACDPYGCITFRVHDGSSITLNPVPPLYRPRVLASCLYLDLPEPIIVKDRLEVKLVAPFELEVRVGGIVVGYISPKRMKYILVGDVLDGIVCKYYASRLISSIDEVKEGEAIVRVKFKGSESLVPAIAFYITGVDLEAKNGLVHYPPLEVNISKRALSVRVSGKHILSQTFTMRVH